MIIFVKAHPAQQAMSADSKPADLNEPGLRRNPGEPDDRQAATGTGMIKAESGQHEPPIQAPKGGATSPYNGEFYDGGQFMPSQDMPKPLTKKVQAVARKTEGGNIAELVAKRGMSGGFNVYKRMAGSEKRELVFTGSEQEAAQFMSELVRSKSAESRRNGLQPHPTEVTMTKSTPAVLFLKTHVNTYVRKDGTVVAAHEDKRQKHADVNPTNLWEIFDSADRRGGLNAVAELAHDIASHRPDLASHIRQELNDLGYSSVLVPSEGSQGKKDPQVREADSESKKPVLPERFSWVSEEQLQAATQILERIQSIKSRAIGLRVIPSDDHKDYSDGDDLPISYKWKNGDMTDKPLNGTSTAGIKSKTIESVLDALHALGALGRKSSNGFYFGDRVALVRGVSGKKGEDAGEKVIAGAKVAGIWKKQSKGLSSIVKNGYSMAKSNAPAILFFKAHVGPYLRGGKMVNLNGYHTKRIKRVEASAGQSALFPELAMPEKKADPKVARALTTWMARHGGPAGMARLLADMSSEHQGKLIDAMATIGKTDAETVRKMLQAEPAPASPLDQDLFGEPQHTEPTRELIAEHERLVDVLRSPSHADDKAEAKKQAAELAEMKGESEPPLDIPGAKWRRGKGLISGHYGVEVGGQVVGNYHAKPEDAVTEAKQTLANRDQWAKDKAARTEAIDKMRERLMSGGDATDQDLQVLGLRAGSSWLEWFIPAAAEAFGINSRSVRPHIKDLIRIGHTDMGVKKESVEPKKALQAVAAGLAPKPAIDDDHPAPIPRSLLSMITEDRRDEWKDLHRQQHELHHYDLGQVREKLDRLRSKRNKAQAALRESEAAVSSLKRAPIPDPERETAAQKMVDQHHAEFTKLTREQDALVGQHQSLYERISKLGRAKEQISAGSGELDMDWAAMRRRTAAEQQDHEKSMLKRYRDHYKARDEARKRAGGATMTKAIVFLPPRQS